MFEGHTVLFATLLLAALVFTARLPRALLAGGAPGVLHLLLLLEGRRGASVGVERCLRGDEAVGDDGEELVEDADHGEAGGGMRGGV